MYFIFKKDILYYNNLQYLPMHKVNITHCPTEQSENNIYLVEFFIDSANSNDHINLIIKKITDTKEDSLTLANNNLIKEMEKTTIETKLQAPTTSNMLGIFEFGILENDNIKSSFMGMMFKTTDGSWKTYDKK